MEHKEAANVLIKLSEKALLTAEEKEAALIAVGVLAWTYLAQNKIKGFKARREKIANELAKDK